jgi:hypothetical protein
MASFDVITADCNQAQEDVPRSLSIDSYLLFVVG